MSFDQFVQYLLFLHAFSGGLALFFGLIALISEKGGKPHRVSGKVFFVSMLVAAGSAFVLCCLPGHYNLFLFLIGIFSSYFALSGYRALGFRKKSVKPFDYSISIVLLLCGLSMIVLPIVLYSVINVVLLVFGVAAIIFAVRDFVLFKNPERLRKGYLALHLGNMIGSYISATTAFIVVNNIIPGVIGWIAPGVVGGVFISIWTRKYSVSSK